MQVAVLGAGTMGRGIAHVCAVAGHVVVLRDVDEDVLEEADEAVRESISGAVERGKLTEDEANRAQGHVRTTTDMSRIDEAALVIEAVPERLDIKHDVLGDVERHVADDAIIATNTSSLSVTEVANTLDDPSRAVGLHFFNPAYVMELVEVVLAEQTSEETHRRALAFVEGIDRTPITVDDAPGFASSRLGVALGCEAMRMVQEGVATPEDIDTAMELGYRHPVGPLKLTDVVGLDVRLDILEYLREELGERFRPPQVLRRKVRAGKLGKKSGEGFYVWENGEAVRVSGEGDG